jgi:hypothetical protein
LPTYRAGTGTIFAGFSSVIVFFLPMANNNYRVTVTFTSTGPIAGTTGTCEGTIDGCVYASVTNKTLTSFQVTLRSAETGAASGTPSSASFDWIALQDQGQTGQQDAP